MQKKLNKYILAASLVLIASVSLFLTNLIYTSTLEDAKKNHQMQQLEMAKVVAEGTRYFVYHLIKDMDLLTENPAFNLNDNAEFRKVINQFRNNYDETIISSIVVAVKGKKAEFIAGKDPPEWVSLELKQLTSSGFALNEYKFLASDVFPDNPENLKSEKTFLIILPLKNSLNRTSSSSQSYIGFLVNFDSLIKHFIMPLKLTSNDFVWILDGDGRLIYHPKHEEMLFNSIFDLKDECRSCHISFDDQLKIVKSSKPAYGEYLVQGDEPSKIFAYVPVQIENKRWYIAVSTLLPDVISGLKERFKLFFILGIFILFTLLSFVFIIYYLNLRRIKSEEEKRNLEKITDYQEQLFHSSKLASIGEIVDSVAHEINTPMGIISAHADSIILQDGPEQGLKEELEIIKRQTRRVSDYTRSLLNFSRRMPFQPEEINVVQLIEESLYLLNPRIREKRIKIDSSFSSKEVTLCADKRQLEQVFINIINNAIDASTENSRITIKIKQNIKKTRVPGSDPVDYVLISIEDNGTGIKKSDLQKIFDPFFTTKLNTGTGLGLSISKSIIQRHMGKINVESKEGKGTVFIIILPKKVSDYYE